MVSQSTFALILLCTILSGCANAESNSSEASTTLAVSIAFGIFGAVLTFVGVTVGILQYCKPRPSNRVVDMESVYPRSQDEMWRAGGARLAPLP